MEQISFLRMRVKSFLENHVRKGQLSTKKKALAGYHHAKAHFCLF